MAEVIFDGDGGGAEVETDVLVVGGGAAGLTAAIAAVSAGAEVVLLEREPTPSGTTAMSQGAICAAGTALQRAEGIEDSAERFVADIMAKTRGAADPVMARLIAGASGPTMDWLSGELGLPYAVNPGWVGFFGHTVNRLHSLPSQTGTELSARLQAAAAERGVEIVCNAQVVAIHATPEGRVTGATLRRPDGSGERIACRALVAATCGFGANREMVRRFIPGFGESPVYRSHAPSGADGSGIRWGMALGAAVGSMTAFQGYGALAEPEAILMNYNVIMSGGVQLNARGERFCDELADISGQALRVLAQPGGVVWMVYDEARHREAESLPEYRELLALGAVKQAADAAALAARIGAEPAVVEATLAAAVAAAEGRAPCPFGRDFRGAAPLTAPYRAVKVTGALFHTQGGLQLDENASVVREDGTPLPNFFAAGGTARGISGEGASGYLPAAGLCSAVTLGRLAGLRAAEAARATAPA